MAPRIARILKAAKSYETLASLVTLTVGPGSIFMLIELNVPDWAIIAAVLVLCGGSTALPAFALRRRVNRRLDRQQEAFRQLWRFAHERGLFEHVEKDGQVASQLERVERDFYGGVPTPHPKSDPELFEKWNH